MMRNGSGPPPCPFAWPRTGQRGPWVTAERGAPMRRLLAILAGLALASLVGIPPQGLAASAPNWDPKPVGMLDCNGYSPIQQPVKRGLPCAEIAANEDDGFEDN